MPYALVGGAAGAALIFPGLWLYGAYAYPYHNYYNFHNRTNSSQPANQNTSLPVQCLCQMYNACGCDDNTANSTYLDGVVGNGSMSALNSSLAHVGDVNGTRTLVLNGTLPNGTDTENDGNGSSATSTSAATALGAMEGSGLWVLAVVGAAGLWVM